MTATELKKRAIALAEKTKIDSVTPEEVGQLSNDIVEYIENVEINGSSLGIRKTYTSVSAMEADSTAPKDDKGVLLRRGMLVNIYNQSEPDSADNGKVFSFQNPGWAFRGTVDAGYATKEELTELEENQYLLSDIKTVYENTERLFTWTTTYVSSLSNLKIKEDGTIESYNLAPFRYIKVTPGKIYLLKNTRGYYAGSGGIENYQVPYCFYNTVPSTSVTTENVVGDVPAKRYVVGERYYVLIAPEGAEYLATCGFNGAGTQVLIEFKEENTNRIDDVESRLSENDTNISKLFSLIEKAKVTGDWVDIPLQNNPYIEFTKGKNWQESDGKVVLGNASSITAVKVNVSAFGNIDYIRAKFSILYNWRFCYGADSEGTIIKDFTDEVAQGIPDNLDKKFIGFANSNFDYFYFNILTTNIEEAKLGFFVGDYYLPNEPYNGFIKVWKPTELLDVKQTLPTILKDTSDYYGVDADKYTIIEESPKRIEGIRTMFSNASANFSIAIAIKVDEDRFSIISDEIPCNTERGRANLLALLENPIILKANQYLAIKCTSGGVMIPTNYQTYTGYRYSNYYQTINKSIVNAYHPIEIVEYVDRNKYLLSDEKNNVSGLACREIHFLSDYNAARNIKADGTFNHVLSSEVKVKNALYDVRAMITVPADYLTKDKKYPLVLTFHENGANAERIIDTTGYNICQYLVSLGYICCCTEISQDWAKENGLYSGEGTYQDLNVYASPLMLQTYIDLYRRIVEEYNIDTEKVYMTGGSMGGFHALSLAEIFPFRIAAVAADSPVLDSRVLWYSRPETHKYTAEYFNFDNKDSIQNTSEDIFEEAKLDGSNYCVRNIQGEYPFEFDKTTDNSLIVKWKNGVDVSNMTWKKFTAVPTKSIVSEGDTSCGCENQEAYITALKRGGSIADIRVWKGGGHISSSSISKYIMQQSRARILSSTGTIYATHYEIADWFYKFGGLKPVVALQEGMKFEIGLPGSIELTENLLTVQAFVNFDDITDDRDKGIKWSLAEEDAAIARINAFGKLTLTGVGSITLTATSLAVSTMTTSKIITISELSE